MSGYIDKETREATREVAVFGMGWYVVLVAFVCLLGYGIYAFDIFTTKTLGVADANAKRQVFEQSKSYREGKSQDLIRYRHEYMTSDALGKKAVAATVRQAFADFDSRDLSPEMRDFLNECNMQ